MRVNSAAQDRSAFRRTGREAEGILVDRKLCLNRQTTGHVHVLASGSLESIGPLHEVISLVRHGHDRRAAAAVGDRLQGIAFNGSPCLRRVSQRVAFEFEERDQLTISRRGEPISRVAEHLLLVLHPADKVIPGIGDCGEGHLGPVPVNSAAKDCSAFRRTGREAEGIFFDRKLCLNRQTTGHVHVLASGSLESIGPLHEVISLVRHGHDRRAAAAVGDRLQGIAFNGSPCLRRVSQRVAFEFEERDQLTISRRGEDVNGAAEHRLVVLHPGDKVIPSIGHRGEGRLGLMPMSAAAKDRAAFGRFGREADGIFEDRKPCLDRQDSGHSHVLPGGGLEAVAPFNEAVSLLRDGHDGRAALAVGDRLEGGALDCAACFRRVSQGVTLQIETRGQVAARGSREGIGRFGGNDLAVLDPIDKVITGTGHGGEGCLRPMRIGPGAEDRAAFRGTG